MADDERSLLVKLLGDATGAVRAFDSAEKAGGGFGATMGKIGSIASGFVLGTGIMNAPGALLDMARSAAEDEAATDRLRRALENYAATIDDDVLGITSELMDDMNDRIAVGQKLAFTDDDVRDSMQKLIASTGDYGEATKRSTLAMDLARGAQIPLAQASTLLGKVTEENVNVFKRMGITMKDGATEADVLATIQAKFGGQADAYAKSTAGQFEVAQIRMAEAKETIGAAVLPVMALLAGVLATRVLPAFETVAHVIQIFGSYIGVAAREGDAFNGFLDGVPTPLLNIAIAVGNVVVWFRDHAMPTIRNFVDNVARPKLTELAGIVQEKLAAFRVYYESDVKPALDNIIAAVQAVIGFIVEHWPEIMAVIGPVISEVGVVVSTAFNVITGLVDVLIQLLGGDFSGAWRALGGVVGAVWHGIEETARNSINVVIGLMNGLIRAWNAISFDIDLPFGNSIHVGTPDLPYIPRLAEGGVVTRPTLAMIGEAGPEAVVPLNRAGGMGNHYHFHIDKLIGSSREAEDFIARSIVNARARGVAV